MGNACSGSSRRGTSVISEDPLPQVTAAQPATTKPDGLSAAALAKQNQAQLHAGGRKVSCDSDRLVPPHQAAGCSASCDSPAGSAANLSVTSIAGERPDQPQPSTCDRPEGESRAVVRLGRADSAHLGSPYVPYECGPPIPPCNDARLETLAALQQVDEPPDPEIEHIVTLICNVFRVKAALVALVGDERIFIRNAQGFSRGDFPWRWSFCAWTLAPKHGQVMVIEDAHKDTRFAENQFVVGQPHVRAYIGTPLIASDNQRLGTLCFVDQQPRVMDAEQCQILNNMAELVVREIEKGAKLHMQRKKGKALQQVNAGLLRAMDCFQDAIMFVDTSAPRWRILHINTAWTALLGVKRQAALETAFWDLFGLRMTGSDASTGAKPWELYADEAQAGKPFNILGTRHMASNKLFHMTFRPATKEALDSNTIPIGIPSSIPQSSFSSSSSATSSSSSAGSDSHAAHFFFVSVSEALTLSQAAQQGTGTGSSSSCDALAPTESACPGLELGCLIGKGSFGRVYRGLYHGQVVAVKIMDGHKEIKVDVDGVPLEAALTQHLRHSNVLATLHYNILKQDPQEEVFTSDSANSSVCQCRPGPQTWLVLEYCDRGCLQDGIDRGIFKTVARAGKALPRLEIICPTALDIARGMAFLHQHGVIHGDLTGGNVLLTSSSADERGFTAKIADFGLARDMQIRSRIETATYGTVSHMPPELLEKGDLSKAADVFAFGVIMWEMACGSRAWAGLNHAQVIHEVAVEKRMLVFPSTVPASYAALAQRCMSRAVDAWPTFQQLCDELPAMHTSLLGQPISAA